MKIASINVNGIRARMPILLAWLADKAPEVVCIQETKVQDKDFPRQPLEAAGYHCSFKGQKSYNGVAILSRRAPTLVAKGFEPGDTREGPRLISARIEGIDIVNTYVPQGQDPASDKFRYKLDWLARLKGYFESHYDPGAPLVWTGDFNVAPDPIDVYDPQKLAGSIGYHPEEHRALAAVKGWGFVDVYRRHHPGETAFTFWDYRIPKAVKRGLGWRIDHIWATRSMADRSTAAWIDAAPRLLPKPSDHTFIGAEFEQAA